MLFISKTQFELNEDTLIPKKYKNKQRKAIHHKISQILGLDLLRSSKDSSKRDQESSGKYQLFSEKNNDNDPGSCEDLRKTLPSLAINREERSESCNEIPSVPSPSSPIPRQRKLTPPPLPDHLSSQFPSTRSNRRGKNPSGEGRQRKKSICDQSPVIHVLKETCINVKIGRMVCRKYIPRLQGIEEHADS